MVEERGYQRQVRTQAGAPLPQTSAASFGAGVGRELARTGEVLHSEKLEDARIERRLRENAQSTEFDVAFAGTREDFSALAREARKSDEPGHAQRMREQWAKREGELLKAIPSERVRQRAQGSLANWGATFLAREADWEQVRQSELIVDRTQDQITISEGRTRRLERPSDYAAELTIQMDAIAGLDIADELKEKLADEAEQRLAISFVRGSIDRDPNQAKAMLDSGAFDGVLSGDQVESLLNSSAVEIRRVEAQREREAAEAKAQLREQVQTFEAAEGAGLIEDPESYDAAIAAAVALGDDSTALKLEVLKAGQQFVRIWGPENASALQRERRVAELAKTTGRSDSENLELAFLRKHNSTWASQEASDPVGQAAARGGPSAPPPIDLADGASWSQRAQWSSARGAPMFTKLEVRELQTLLEDPRGELQVLGELDKIGDGFARAQAAEQLAPDDALFRLQAMVQPQVRAVMRQGQKAIGNNPSFFKVDALGPDEAIVEAKDIINFALREFDEDFRESVRQGWQAYAAGNATANGLASFQDVDEDRARNIISMSLRVALGGERRNGRWVGGFDEWNGRWYALPETMDEAGFKQRLNRHLAQSKSNPPVNPDGSEASLYRAVPVAVGGGWYEFESLSGDPIRAEQGGRYRVRIGR